VSARPAALVTGRSRGIGLATALRLAAGGRPVALVARGEAGLSRAERAMGDRGAECLAIRADVSSAPEVDRAFAAAIERFGTIDLVVHAAGILSTGRFDRIPVEDYESSIRVNYLGAVHVARAALPRLAASGNGCLVQVASVIAFKSFPGFAAYAPTKWAVRALHETLDAELRQVPVRLAIVYPPITDTAMIRDIPADRRPAVYDRFGSVTADEVAAAIVRGIESRSRRIFVRRTDWLYFHLTRLAPGITGRVLDRMLAGRGGISR